MAKPSAELSKKRGERVKSLIEKHNTEHPKERITQKALAEYLSMPAPVLNAKLSGSRTLTEDDARRIASFFPRTRYQYIMCYDDNETSWDEFISRNQHFLDNNNAIRLLLQTSAAKYGYTFADWVPIPEDEGYNISVIKFESQDGRTMYARSDIVRDVLDFIDYKVDRLIKEASDNG